MHQRELQRCKTYGHANRHNTFDPTDPTSVFNFLSTLKNSCSNDKVSEVTVLWLFHFCISNPPATKISDRTCLGSTFEDIARVLLCFFLCRFQPPNSYTCRWRHYHVCNKRLYQLHTAAQNDFDLVCTKNLGNVSQQHSEPWWDHNGGNLRWGASRVN